MKYFYWSISTFFFFVAASVVISTLKPGPTETQVMNFMQGMMAAMENSIMGASMENGEFFSFMLKESAVFAIVMMFIGIAAGITMRLWRKYD